MHRTRETIDMQHPPTIGTDPMGWPWTLAAPQAAADRMRLTPARSAWPLLATGRWATNWDRCRECGATERPHWATGLCDRCYPRAWAQRRREAMAS